VNKFNDNYDHYYIKICDASRIYGLELEDLLSPNRIKYRTDNNTLVEEHIAGVPGDVFISSHLNDPFTNRSGWPRVRKIQRTLFCAAAGRYAFFIILW